MQRYTPFGYKVENGEIAANEPEATAVRMIFKFYLDGLSYKEIAAIMESQRISYNESSACWNKNMVKRILENNRYIGKQDSPKLISEPDFERVSVISAEKYTRKAIQVPTAAQSIKSRALCLECGNQFKRLHDSRVREKWYCENSKCKTELKITDAMLQEAVVSLLNRLIAELSLVQAPAAEPCYSLEITKLNNEINRELGKRDCNEDYVKSLIMACAAEKYETCDDGGSQYQSEQLRSILERQNPITDFDDGLFEKTVRHLFIGKDGTVSLQLINGQTIG